MKRTSNLELLKIIAMFLICISHVSNVLIYDFHYGELYSINAVTWLIQFFKTCGWLGDYIFIYCSCLFASKIAKFNWRKALLYSLDVIVILYLFLGVCLLAQVSVSHDLIISTLSLKDYFEFWFVFNYVIFLFFVPILNKIVSKINQRTHKLIVAGCLILSVIFLVISHTETIGNGSRYLKCLSFYFCYFIVSYGLKYGSFIGLKENNKKLNIIVIICLTLLWYGSIALINILVVKYPFFGNYFKCVSMNIVDYYSPIFIYLGLALVLLFKNFNIKQSKLVNFIASLSLLFYVSHENHFTQLLFNNYFTEEVNAMTFDYRLPLLFYHFALRFVFGICVSIFVFFIFEKPVKKLLYREHYNEVRA